MVNFNDPFAGWATLDGLNYSVRERGPCHDSIDFDPGQDLDSDVKMDTAAAWCVCH